MPAYLLCTRPTLACMCCAPQDINSPFRHVRTRIYFTSESHMHSLLNVLRFSHMGELVRQAAGSPSAAPDAALMCHGRTESTKWAAPDSHSHQLCHSLLFHSSTPGSPGNEGEEPLLGEDGLRVLRACEELDYMTHIVLRMFENMT